MGSLFAIIKGWFVRKEIVAIAPVKPTVTIKVTRIIHKIKDSPCTHTLMFISSDRFRVSPTVITSPIQYLSILRDIRDQYTGIGISSKMVFNKSHEQNPITLEYQISKVSSELGSPFVVALLKCNRSNNRLYEHSYYHVDSLCEAFSLIRENCIVASIAITLPGMNDIPSDIIDGTDDSMVEYLLQQSF